MHEVLLQNLVYCKLVQPDLLLNVLMFEITHIQFTKQKLKTPGNLSFNPPDMHSFTTIGIIKHDVNKG